MTPGRGLLAAVLPLALLASCGDTDDTGDTTPPTSVVVNVAEALLTPNDLGTGWSVTEIPEDEDPTVDGVVRDDQQQDLPRPELCEEANSSARTALETLRWRGFRSLELDVADPIEPPLDRSGHLVFLQQLISVDTPDQQRATFDLLEAGYQACLGAIPADEEGPGQAVSVTLPAIGDDQFGVLVTIEEAGAWAEWRIHQVLVLDGSVLLSLVVGDVRSVDVDPYFTDAQIAAMATMAIERIRSRTSP